MKIARGTEGKRSVGLGRRLGRKAVGRRVAHQGRVRLAQLRYGLVVLMLGGVTCLLAGLVLRVLVPGRAGDGFQTAAGGASSPGSLTVPVKGGASLVRAG
jgi:hypothetical protein